jgi:O-antigen/teichoic acid export membrane protein
VSKALGVAAVAIGAALALFGPWAFELVFGSRWAVAGDMARAYSIAAAAQMLASPLSQTLVVYERTVLQLCWDASRLVLTAGSIIAAWRLDASVTEAVWALSAVTTLTYLANWEACRRTVQASAAQPSRSVSG